jgi:hypothetical protein
MLVYGGAKWQERVAVGRGAASGVVACTPGRKIS